MECETTLSTGERVQIVVRPSNLAAVDIYADGTRVGGATTLVDAAIRGLAAHPDGALVLVGGQVGKVTRDPSGAWSYKAVGATDLSLAQVDDDPVWVAASRVQPVTDPRS